jgi:hypothetical protein
MNGNFKVGLGMLVSFGLGAAAVIELHAQATPLHTLFRKSM